MLIFKGFTLGDGKFIHFIYLFLKTLHDFGCFCKIFKRNFDRFLDQNEL